MDETFTGQRVRCRTAMGDWFETIARSEPFLNRGYVGGRVEPWMVVAVDLPRFDRPVNWPLEDVELIEVASR